MKFFTKEVQIALVAIAGVVVLFFGMKFLKGLTVFSTDENYYVEFKDITGLSVSCPVYASGYRVGVVEDIVELRVAAPYHAQSRNHPRCP